MFRRVRVFDEIITLGIANINITTCTMEPPILICQHFNALKVKNLSKFTILFEPCHQLSIITVSSCLLISSVTKVEQKKQNKPKIK